MPSDSSRRPSVTEIGRLIDWNRLPTDAAPIARMLLDGYTQVEIARNLGLTEDHVGTQLRRLRESMVEMALERADELSIGLREVLEEIRNGNTFGGNAPLRR